MRTSTKPRAGCPGASRVPPAPPQPAAWLPPSARAARGDALAHAMMHSELPGRPMEGYFGGRDLRTGRFEDWRTGARASAALLAEARGPDGTLRIDFVSGVERWPGAVLFLAGSCDPVVGEAQQRLHMESFPRAELVVVEGAGHTLFGEKPVESVAAVRRHLERSPGLAVSAP